MAAAKKREPILLEGLVSDLTHAGEGVVRHQERVYFVPGALPGERIRFLAGRKRRGRFNGRLEEVLQAAPDRVVPRCHYFGTCGGCTLQHLSIDSQRRNKEKILLDNLQRIGRVSPDTVLPMLAAEPWHYRRKARPGCKFVPGKGGILVGFREQGSAYLTSLRDCYTLDPRLAALLDPLHEMISTLDCQRQVPQLEFAAGDSRVALVLRHLVPLSAADEEVLKRFAVDRQVQMFVQPGGLDSIRPLWPQEPEPLSYRLEAFHLTMTFDAVDFIQVNAEVNELMIRQALAFLDPGPGDHVLDLFCGLGNFTLPIARSGASVIGVEGERSLVAKGAANADRNGLTNVGFELMNLHDDAIASRELPPANKLLLDPPRSGAQEVVRHLVGPLAPEVIVYVSCNPATLARDAEILVHGHGYQLGHAGAMDMFPHTAHVESMAVFFRA